MRNLDILATANGEHIRVLLCGEEQSYVVSCQHFRMPYPVASDLLAELQPVPAEMYSVFVLDEDITNRQREGRNRKLDLIAPLLEDACIYDKSHRNEVVRQIATEHGIARRTVLQYLWRYWVYQSKNALLPAERPTPEQHELTTDEKAIRWALNKYYYAPQRQSLQTAYKMMLRAKYCDAHGTLKPEYPTFWQFRYFFRKNRDPISETISRQGLKAYQRNHRPFTGSVCDYASDTARLHVSGRRCPQQDYVLSFDADTCIWSMVGNSAEADEKFQRNQYERSEAVVTIKEAVARGNGSWSGSMSDLSRMTETIPCIGHGLGHPRSLSNEVNHFKNDLCRYDGITITIAKNGTGGRKYTFSKAPH